jgi:predicted component of type VI protein secretion system
VDLAITVHSQSDNNYKSYRLSVSGRLALGRGPDSAVPLQGTQLSREHLALRVEDGTLYVDDLSTNGTRLNGALLMPGSPRRASAGDTISIPGFDISLDSVGEPQRAPSPASTEPSPADTVTQQPSPAPAAAGMLDPIRGFWAGFSGVERTVIYAALACIVLVIAYLQSN